MNQETIEPQDEMKEVLNESLGAESIEAEPQEEVETPEAEAPAPEEAGTPEEKSQRRNKVSAGQRISQFRRKLGDSERENDSLKKRIEALESSNPKPKELSRPSEDSYNTHAEYITAVDEFHKADREAYANQKLADRDAKRKEEDNNAQIEETNRKQAEDWAKKTASAVKENPNYKAQEDELIEDIHALNAQNLFSEILACDNGAKIVSSLHGDYSELERIAQLSPRAAAKAIWNLDNKFSATKKGNSPLPPPTKERRFSGGSVPRGSKKPESQTEYNRRMNGF